MKKEKGKILLAKAQEMGYLKMTPIKVWVQGTKERRTFGGMSNNAADLVRDYLDQNDPDYVIGTKKTGRGHTHYYHLASNLNTFIEVYVRIAGFYAYNPANFPTEIAFYTQDEGLIRTIVRGIQKLWITPMLNELNYAKFQKHFNITPEDIKAAWEKWAGSDEALPTSTPPQSRPPFCPNCGKPTTFIPEYKRYYCYPCKKYV